MVGEMVQNSQSLYSFTFSALIDIHEYIYSHSATEFTFKKYIYSHLPVFLIHDYICSHLRDVFIHIQRVISIHIHDRNIHSTFSAHHLCASVSNTDCGVWTTDYGLGIKHGLGIKQGLGIKHVLRYKTRTQV